MQLWASIHGRAPFFPTLEQLPPGTTIDIEVPPTPQGQPGLDWFDIRMRAPAALNLPVGIVQLPYVISNPAKTEWVPKGIFIHMWRAMSWPFFGVIFWWMAGRGVEAFVEALRRAISPQLRWIEVAFGLLMLVIGTELCIAFSDRGLQTPPTEMVSAMGGALWAILGAATIAARVLQWRIRRMEKGQDVATAIPA
jgi:hypothetical protein